MLLTMKCDSGHKQEVEINGMLPEYAKCFAQYLEFAHKCNTCASSIKVKVEENDRPSQKYNEWETN